MAKPTLASHIRAASTPYGLREHLGRFFLTTYGHVLPNQYGSMDEETALRIYRMFRDAWLTNVEQNRRALANGQPISHVIK